ncbi:hypothetical protein [Xanthomonas sp. 4461]|uniref:hypothetical protein n=1 Tax=Xanthomonas sp. 4461 TaxID=3035313 RepID=UPI0021686E94|nr:hypothetical protein [Xanthomonas sp. 4461]MCS3810369.1 hypothetical protein [Xanthomonas sp. 4461]
MDRRLGGQGGAKGKRARCTTPALRCADRSELEAMRDRRAGTGVLPRHEGDHAIVRMYTQAPARSMANGR